MMIVDDRLNWARGRGYTAVYGSPEQVNEMLTNVPFSESKDGTAVIMHLVTASETVDGRDRAVVAVYFASLCPFDFDGEALLHEQERLKMIGKEMLNDIRTGNVLTYDNPRWQYGYNDYAENVAWVCLRVTLTVSAADCVPLSPEPPTPPAPQQSAHYCPQVLNYANLQGYPNPAKTINHYRAAVSYCVPPDDTLQAKPLVVGSSSASGWATLDNGVEITEDVISAKRTALGYLPADRKMKPETEQWLRDRIGWRLYTFHFSMNVDTNVEYTQWLIAGTSALNCEKAKVNLIQ